jgi:hypothetical protein
MSDDSPRYFRVIFVDHDAKTVNFSTVLNDDADILERTREQERRGRKVSVSRTTPVEDSRLVPSKESLEAGIESGYKYDPWLGW